MARSDEVRHSILTEFQQLHNERGTLDSRWTDIARIASPRDNMFNRTITEGQDLRQDQYDELAEQLLDRATAIYGAITTPDNQRWHRIRSTNTELNKSHAVREYWDELTDILFSHRYRPRANFSANKFEENRSLWGFGNGAMFIGEGSPFENPLWYKAIHLSELYFSENNQHLVDKVYRKYPMTVRQVREEYGQENIPASIDGKKDEDKVQVIHCVRPNPDFDPESLNVKKLRYTSKHLLLTGADTDDGFLREGGFSTFPYAISRDARTPQEVYGRGTLQKVLPAISMRSQQKRTFIRVSHTTSDPVILMRDDSSIDPRDFRPGHFVSGGLDVAGNPTVQPFDGGGRPDINIEAMAAEEQTISKAFLLDLFDMDFGNRDRVTATEILERSREQGRLLTPLVSRSETESLGPMITREIDILDRLQLLPPPPGEIVEAEGEFEIEFTSPITLAQKSEEAIGSVRTVERAMEASQFNPDILDNINWDAYLNTIHLSEGAPTVILNSPEDIEAIRAARQQQQDLQQLQEAAATAAPGIGQMAKNLAQAEEISAGG